MKRLFHHLGAFLVILFLPFTACAEEVKDFHATITVSKDSSMNVVERILYDFGNLARHGIYRTIPYTKTNKEDAVYEMTINNFSVLDNIGVPYRFTEMRESGNVKLKIGDADKTITGQKVYSISYTVNGAFVPYSDHDELYWNITGNNWEVPIAKVQAGIVLPFAPNVSEMQLTCFSSAYQSTEKNCKTFYDNGTITVQSSGLLAAGQGLTVVIGFPKNMMTVVEAKKVDSRESTFAGMISSALLFLGGLLWYAAFPMWIIFHWLKTGRDPKGTVGQAHVWFDVPKLKNGKALTPGETGTLVDETADLRDITATIIDLARRGYLKIMEKKKKDFYLAKTMPKKDKTPLESFEKKLYTGLFEDGDSIRIKDTDLTPTVGATKAELYETVVRDGLFPKNPQTQRTLSYILAGVGLFTGNFFLAVVAFLFGRAMPRKTVDGVNAAHVALALKGFIISQDKQYKYQAEQQLFFEKFLPFAIIFGVERIWAERFKDIGIEQPSWYESYTTSAFTTMYLVNSLSSGFSPGVVTAATPTRSSSGFSSGFSGGGFSGGGGGGGGGGSW